MTQYAGLIGCPLGHSLSPAMQQAAFDHLGLDACYELWETKQEDVPAAIEGIRNPSKLGANVTVPYKETVLTLVDQLDDLAQQIGAVNTIVNTSGKLAGYNTDAGGFLRALRDDAGFNPSGKRAVLIGSGGVARAVGFALVKGKARSIAVTDVLWDRALRLAEDLRRAADSAGGRTLEVKPLALDSGEFAGIVWSSDLLVNCSPIGMKHSPSEGQSPIEKALIPKGILVFDVVYNPAETRLLADAAKAGARTLGGLSMLVYQGALAFELWTGKDAPVDIMMAAARESL